MLECAPLIDISPPLSEKLAVFPGDTPYHRTVDLDFKKGDNLLLSHISCSLHAGAHADAPNHYHPEGEGIAERPLRPYLGRAQVIEVHKKPGERIVPEDFARVSIKAPRVLFKTGSFPDPDCWNGDFNSLSRACIEELASKGVILVGIDTPSVDPADDKELETHQSIYRADMAILEGLDLSHVTPGLYQLIALPLRLMGADASPVRAVLLKEGQT